VGEEMNVNLWLTLAAAFNVSATLVSVSPQSFSAFNAGESASI